MLNVLDLRMVAVGFELCAGFCHMINNWFRCVRWEVLFLDIERLVLTLGLLVLTLVSWEESAGSLRGLDVIWELVLWDLLGVLWLWLGVVDLDGSSVGIFIIAWWWSQVVFSLLLWMLNLRIFLGTSKERIAKVQVTVLISMLLEVVLVLLVLALLVLVLMLRLLLVMLVWIRFQKDRDGDLDFFDHWIGLGNLLFDDFLNGVGNFDFFYLNHGIRFWHFDFFYNGIRDLRGNETQFEFWIGGIIEVESFSSFWKSSESSPIQKLQRAFKGIKPLKYLLLHNFFYMDWIGLGNMDLWGFWLE
jgi:hypothetical protein